MRHALIPRLNSRPQEMESLNQDLAAISSWSLKWHMRLNPKKTKSIVVSRSRGSGPGNGDFTLGGAVIEEVKSLPVLGVTLDSKLTFETHLREVVSKTAINLGVAHRTAKLCDCLRELMDNFNAYVLSNLDYCASAWMSSAESYLSLLNSIVRSAETVCKGEDCCLLYRRKGSALCLRYEIYHRVDHPMNEYLSNFLQLEILELRAL